MRHRVIHKKLKREAAPRAALLRSLARSLLLREHIDTTLVKAKTVRTFVEPLITLGKHKDRQARRMLMTRLDDAALVDMLLSTYAERFAAREGGYTRIVRLGFRQGDGAPMARLSLVQKS